MNINEEDIIRWPSWRYGPNGQSQIFNHPDEVPEGWEDHPSKIGAEEGPDEEESADYAHMSNDDLKTKLTDSHIEFNERWPRKRLIKALTDGKKD